MGYDITFAVPTMINMFGYHLQALYLKRKKETPESPGISKYTKSNVELQTLIDKDIQNSHEQL